MLANAFLIVSLVAFSLAAAANAHPQPHAHIKRWDGYGMCGGYGGFGFPFAASFTSDFDRNSNRANFNENTFYANNVHANAASDNVHKFNNVNVIA
ncbi:hypothetical protein IWW37_004572 [Coemansia sp. RSA 2050]|nr:hypothetical protein IWW37_004572 [Coemansia sp. RSA 2050]KAJ2735139.1 hypothetical protein IW152_001768 [Coemansia sp. BCRC 34962]